MRRHNKIMVTGTGTDVGKTVISAALLFGLNHPERSRRRLQSTLCEIENVDESSAGSSSPSSGSTLDQETSLSEASWGGEAPQNSDRPDLSRPATYCKLVQTGGPDVDLRLVEAAQSQKFTSYASLKTSEAALSPDQACSLENDPGVSVSELVAYINSIGNNCQFLLMEGAGGVQVPLNGLGQTWCDFLKEGGSPCIVVAEDTLGVINHTSLTLKLLEHEGIEVLGVVLNNCGKTSNSMNRDSIQALHPNVSIFQFPYIDNLPGDFNGQGHTVSRTTRSQTRSQTRSEEVNSDKLTANTHHPSRESKSDDEWTEASRRLAEFVTSQIERLDESNFDVENISDQESRSILADDSKYCWHPYTQHKTASPPLHITAAKGIYVYLADGTKLIDGSSSWWVNTIGHGRTEIGSAIKVQQAELDHTIFAGATHSPGVELAREIIKFSQSHLQRVFFSDNGSTAIEVALKMAYQSCANRGNPEKTCFLGFRGSYHGDTLGAMAVAKADDFHSTFSKLFFKTLWATPATTHRSRFCPNGLQDMPHRLSELRTLLAENHEIIAGVIIEPLVQGAGGMLVQPVEFLTEVAQLAHHYELPLIFDEVFTGMGRVGAPFSFLRADVKPDIVCLAKGLTGGNLPLALTLSTEEIYSSFLADDSGMALLHGHSYTANPIACRAALETLKIVRREDLVSRAFEVERCFHQWISRCTPPMGDLDANEESISQKKTAPKTNVENPRAIGAILAFELPGSGYGDYFYAGAASFVDIAREHGLMLRTLGNTVYFVPALSISEHELADALDKISLAVDSWEKRNPALT